MVSWFQPPNMSGSHAETIGQLWHDYMILEKVSLWSACRGSSPGFCQTQVTLQILVGTNFEDDVQGLLIYNIFIIFLSSEARLLNYQYVN